jgi:hypothetical protein
MYRLGAAVAAADALPEKHPLRRELDELHDALAIDSAGYIAAPHAWLTDAADLLAEPDPGPTRYLVHHLIVEKAIVAAVGRWKTTKSYGMLDICIAVATGRPAFGTLAIPEPGPVLFINEESGRAALWRRLDALCRGRGIPPEDLRGLLHVAANARVKLDDPSWQARLIVDAKAIGPRLIVLDPLVRMKGVGRDESAQKEMDVVVEFVRELREETGSAVCFVHHTGHQGEHMRGSSDLESVWETRLRWKRDGQSPLVDIESEHREAEAGPVVRYRIGWDTETRSMRFDADTAPSLADRIVAHLLEHGAGTTDEVQKGVGVRKSDVLRTLEQLETAGTTHRGQSGRLDRLGRPIRDKVWNLKDQAGLWPVPDSGTATIAESNGHCGSVARPSL